MFQSGTYVVYGCKGVHKILGTTRLNLEGIPKDKEYYVMQAVKKPDGAVYAPVEASKTLLDMHFMEQAEDILYEELAISLSISRGEVEEKIKAYAS